MVGLAVVPTLVHGPVALGALSQKYVIPPAIVAPVSVKSKFYNLKGREINEIKDKKTLHISPIIFIPRIMKKFNSNQYHIDNRHRL